MITLPAHSGMCFVVVLCLAGFASGQSGDRVSLIDVLDSDGDGVLSAREIRLASVVIRKLDRNHDGQVTDDEVRASDANADSEASSASPARGRANSGRSPTATRRTETSRGAGQRGASPVSKRAIDGAINRAAAHYMQKKYPEAGKEIEKAQEMIEQLVDDDDRETLATLTESIKRLERARSLLAQHGVSLPELVDIGELGSGTTQPARRPPVSPPRQSNAAEASRTKTATVSYTKQIAPILMKRCGNCHVKDRKGELSFASYETLMAGSKGGSVLVEGSADDSVLVDMVESGDMPPKGDRLPDEELKLIRTWVDEGAVFDGDA